MGQRVWTVEDANEALPRVAALVERAREAVAAARAARVERADLARRNGHARRDGRGDDSRARAEATLREVVGELAEDGIELRDVDRGLVDFPARSPSGRPYLLCWVVGEPEVAWWHWPEDGFAGRTPLSSPPR